MQPRCLSWIIAGLLSLAPTGARAISLSDIDHETFWTTFLDTGGNVGEVYAPTPDQNPIGSVATFGSPGAVAFMNNPPYYLVDPLGWGFAGANRADITFLVGMTSVSIAARGTAGNTVAGPAAVYPFAPNTMLVRAEGFVAALDMSGEIIAGSETAIQRRGLKSALLNEIAFTAAGLGQPIHGVAFVQTVDSTAAGIMVGGIGVTPLPEPGLAWLLATGVALPALVRSRRRTHRQSPRVRRGARGSIERNQMTSRNLFVALLATVGMAAAAPASATLVQLTSSLDCAQADRGLGTCAAGGTGTGNALITFDDQTNLLSWNLGYSGLSAAVTAAHFHGPAMTNENANIAVSIGTSNPAVGSATLSAGEAADLLAELWYINVHSTAFLGGEIRGQVRVPEPAPTALVALAGLAFVLRRST